MWTFAFSFEFRKAKLKFIYTNNTYYSFLIFFRDAFVLLACDGVYDVMSNQEIVDLLAWNLGLTGMCIISLKKNPTRNLLCFLIWNI